MSKSSGIMIVVAGSVPLSGWNQDLRRGGTSRYPRLPTTSPGSPSNSQIVILSIVWFSILSTILRDWASARNWTGTSVVLGPLL